MFKFWFNHWLLPRPPENSLVECVILTETQGKRLTEKLGVIDHREPEADIVIQGRSSRMCRIRIDRDKGTADAVDRVPVARHGAHLQQAAGNMAHAVKINIDVIVLSYHHIRSRCLSLRP